MDGLLNIDLLELSRHAQWSFLLIFLILHFFVGFLVPKDVQSLPFFWRVIGRFSGALNTRLNRKKRSQRARRIRGYIVMLLLMGIAVVFGVLFNSMTSLPESWIGLFVIWAGCISFTIPLKLLKRVMLSVQTKDVELARRALHKVSLAKPDTLDQFGVVRHAIEFSSWAMVRLFIGPVFWFVIAEGMGLGFYVVFAAADRAIGTQNQEDKAFTGAVGRVDKILNYIPLRFAVLLLWVASLFTPNSFPGRALRHLSRVDGLKTKKKQGQHILLSVMAGLTGVSLGGAFVPLVGSSVKRPWFGSQKASAKVSGNNIQTVLILYLVVFAWSLLALLLLISLA